MSDVKSEFNFNISLSVLNHLGRNLYRNFITVLAEAVSNAWDADANNVYIEFDKEKSILVIKDDGAGMDADAFQNQFLKIGYSKRKDGKTKSEKKRPYIGAKGIGKLALLSCAERVSIYSKTHNTDYVGGTIDNAGLDGAITNDLVPEQYPLEELDYGLAEPFMSGHQKGTIIVFQGLKEAIKSSEAYLRKLLALTFKFSLLDPDFTIWVNGKPVVLDDLSDLMSTTEFVWTINGYADEYIQNLQNLGSPPRFITSELNIEGFIATVEKPRNLKITGTDERATIDLFVNGRLREKNIIRHIPTQRIVENYVYGQIHFNAMDRDGTDPFTSSREGVVEDDVLFSELIEALRRDFLPIVIDEWDRLRLERNKEGDDENTRKSKRDRKARDLYAISKSDYQLPEDSTNQDKVDGWLLALANDAEFNISAYVDCFLSENLLREYIRSESISAGTSSEKEMREWADREVQRKKDANIVFDIRKNSDPLSYLGLDHLALDVEGGKKNTPLWLDAISYKPVRNAVGHTGLLTTNAKNHLRLRFENIRARLRQLLSGN